MRIQHLCVCVCVVIHFELDVFCVYLSLCIHMKMVNVMLFFFFFVQIDCIFISVFSFRWCFALFDSQQLLFLAKWNVWTNSNVHIDNNWLVWFGLVLFPFVRFRFYLVINFHIFRLVCFSSSSNNCCRLLDHFCIENRTKYLNWAHEFFHRRIKFANRIQFQFVQYVFSFGSTEKSRVIPIEPFNRQMDEEK